MHILAELTEHIPELTAELLRWFADVEQEAATDPQLKIGLIKIFNGTPDMSFIVGMGFSHPILAARLFQLGAKFTTATVGERDLRGALRELLTGIPASPQMPLSTTLIGG